MHRATLVDPEVGRAFARVMNLLAPPTSLMAPAMLVRLLRANRSAGRQPQQAQATTTAVTSAS